MANLVPAKGLAKRDINFFDEFTASARKQAQFLGVLVVSLVALVGIFVVWLFICIFRNAAMTKEINKLNDLLNSEEYQSIEREAADLEAELTECNQYYYALSEMRKTVDETNPAETKVADILGDNIPNDTYVSTYEITGTTFKFTGYTFNYYSAMNIVHLIQESDVFSLPPDISVNRVSAVSYGVTASDVAAANAPENAGDENALPAPETYNVMDVYYQIDVTGTLTNEVLVSLARFTTANDTVAALGGIESVKQEAGTSYYYDGIGTYEYNGTFYSLTGITINGLGVDEAMVQSIATGERALEGVARENIQINLYYTPVDSIEITEGGEE
ncbi:MAG: PilN domain-containing protein [Clostridiales bacterium]|nr:PilN domain-containing protein [Clostridiales bacterium]